MPANAPALFDDAHYLQLALAQARLAEQAGEVPVGAVVVSATGQVLGQGHNRTLSKHDPSAHAEIQALRAAAHTTANHRLEGCTLYVTLEPCAMCSGALLHARLARVVYAVADPKTGAAGSVLDLFAHSALNHQTVCQSFAPQDAAGHALREQCAAILQTFFQARRQAQTALRQQPLHAPLREDALRLPPQHLAHLAPLQDLQRWSQFVLLRDPEQPASPPWRMHVWDTAPHDSHRPAVLLLHGYASYGLLWAELIAPLHAAGWRVLVPDLLGHGQSDKPKKMQRHSLAWHAALLQQWLAQAHFDRHAHRAAVLHDSAIKLLHAWPKSATADPTPVDARPAPTTPHAAAPVPAPEQAAACADCMPFTHTLALLPDTDPEHPASWREACRLRPRFDLDAHWAISPAEVAGRHWSAPWPDAGHRAALQWPQWAQGPAPAHATAPQPDNAPIDHTHATAKPSPVHGAQGTRGTIAAPTGAEQAQRPSQPMQTLAVPSGGAAFRRWLQQHSRDLMQQLQARRADATAPSSAEPSPHI